MNFISGTVWFVVLRAANQTAPIYHSGRLQEEQRLVTKTCPFFWRTNFPGSPNFGELKLSRKSKTSPHKSLWSWNWHPEAGGGGVGGSQEFETVSHLELHWLMEL